MGKEPRIRKLANQGTQNNGHLLSPSIKLREHVKGNSMVATIDLQRCSETRSVTVHFLAAKDLLNDRAMVTACTRRKQEKPARVLRNPRECWSLLRGQSNPCISPHCQSLQGSPPYYALVGLTVRRSRREMHDHNTGTQVQGQRPLPPGSPT